MRRDRLTFGMMIGIPLLQLILFGYAINSNPKHLPTAVLSADHSVFSRTLIWALRNSDYFDFVRGWRQARRRSATCSLGRGAVRRQYPGGFFTPPACGASGRRCWWRPTPPTPRPPATPSRR